MKVNVMDMFSSYYYVYMWEGFFEDDSFYLFYGV